MEFSTHHPPPALAHAVKAIWCARGTQDDFRTPEPIVPDGCVEIVLNFGDRFVDVAAGESQPRDLLAGQMTRPVTAVATGAVDLIGIRLHTARAGAALRTSMWQLEDRLLPASYVVPALGRIADELGGITHELRLARLGELLPAALATSAPSDVDHALVMIDEARGNIAVEMLAKRIGISRRHLERQFRERVGLGVKQLARIKRVHAALALVQRQSHLSGAEIALECGYSDQAHMIRECQQLAGRTPRRMKSTSRSLAGLMRREAPAP